MRCTSSNPVLLQAVAKRVSVGCLLPQLQEMGFGSLTRLSHVSAHHFLHHHHHHHSFCIIIITLSASSSSSLFLTHVCCYYNPYLHIFKNRLSRMQLTWRVMSQQGHTWLRPSGTC